MLKGKFSLLWIAAATLLAVASTGAMAQPGQQQNGGAATNPQSNWSDSLRMVRAENEALTRILSAIESIDTARQNELIQWIITDRNIRSRVISALRKSNLQISPNSVAELTVTQKPPTTGSPDEMQLLRLVIEQIGIYGEPNIRRILGENLYERIRLRQDYEYTLISTEPAQQKIQFVYMDASLFGGQIIFKSGFGFALKVGNDFVGYPFWLPGTMGTYGLLRRGTTDFRIGLEWPLGESGLTPFGVTGGIQIKNRKLVGTQAFGAQIEQDLGLIEEQSGKLHFGGEFFNAFAPSFSNLPLLASDIRYRTVRSLPENDPNFENPNYPKVEKNRDFMYYLGLSTHGWVSYRLPESLLKGAYVQVGGGTHRVNAITVGSRLRDLTTEVPNTDIVQAKQFSYFDPFIKLGYVHNSSSGDDYGVSAQYSNTLLFDGFVKLFPWLQLQAKYAAVVGRDPHPWEWSDYVMVSPKLTLNF